MFAVPSLNALLRAGEKVEAVVTQPDKKKGRGHALSQPSVKELAIKNGIRVLQPEKLKDAAFLAELRSIEPEFIVVVAYGKILPDGILNLPKSACVNVHASLLPKYRGAAPIAWAIINGEKVAGVTTMLISKKLDTGDMLLQKEIQIEPDDNTETLSKKLSELGAEVLIETLKGMRAGNIKPRPQTGEANYVPVIKKEDGFINWSKTALELSNFVRGMYPWPGAYCYLSGEMIKLIKVKVVDGVGAPGRIEKAKNGELIVGTGSGLISVIELQPQSKRAMTAKAFLPGRSIKEGTYFGQA